MIKYVFPIVIGMVLVSCGNNNKTESDAEAPVEKTVSIEDSKYDLMDLSEFGLAAKIKVPNKSFTNSEPKAVLNETSGIIEISSGNKFKLKVSETEIDKALMVSDLKDDLLFKNTIKTDEENLIVYTSELPDGSGSFDHFCAWLNVDGAMYLVQNDDQEKVSKHYLDRMIDCVKTIQINGTL
ncbi:MAG: hypothetical protein HKN39_00765 [Flavobacteriales bacterium]|nr:hypothetical protein [Flavobacteriales bacterium]